MGYPIRDKRMAIPWLCTSGTDAGPLLGLFGPAWVAGGSLRESCSLQLSEGICPMN
jgi:hypothetical protein